MYDLPHHKEHDPSIISEFIDQHPFAVITGCDADNKPVATQIPVFIEEKNGRKLLRGHIMKNTDHHKAFIHNPNVLVIFSGSHTYVSGTWYDNPFTPSTWNYMSVQVKGIVSFLDDDALIDMLRMTTLHFEKYDQSSTTIYDNLPSEYTKKLMKAIVAFEIEVVDIDTVFKLSQDRDEKSYDNIIIRLKELGGDGQVIAREMEKRINKVFPGKQVNQETGG